MKQLAFIFLSLLVLAAIYDSSTGRERKAWTGYATDDSVDTTWQDGRATTPSTRTPWAEDSILKHTRFIVRYAEGTQPLENIEDELPGGWALLRDSAFVLRGRGCLVFRGYRGSSPSVPDTIEIEDTCATNCWALRTYPLGCTDTVWTELIVTTSYTRCDTICYYEFEDTRDSAWLELSEIAFQELYFYNGNTCDQSAPGTGCLWFDATKNKWIINYQELTNPNYPWKACDLGSTCGPTTQQKCCVSITTLYAWLAYQYGIYDIGPYVSHVEVTETQRLYVDCAENTTAIHDTVNCRTVEEQETIRIPTERFTPAGRDTTVLVDTCNPCIMPRFECIATVDTVRDTLITNVYDKKPIYDTTYDTIPCVQQYTTTIAIESVWTPPSASGTPCFSYLAVSAITCHASWAPNRWPMTYDYIGTVPGVPGSAYINPCFVCYFDPDTWTPPPGKLVCWVDGPEYTPFQLEIMCVEGGCQLTPVQEVRFGPCCPKDTTVIGYCVDGEGNIIDLTSITSQTPNLDTLCSKDTIRMNIEIIGWTDSLVRVDTTIRKTPLPVSITYEMTWQDTCICIPTVNGRQFCDPIWIMFCGKPLKWEGNVLNIPCPEESAADALTSAQVNEIVYYPELRWESMDIRSDAQANLQDTAEALRTDISAVEIDLDSLRSLADNRWSSGRLWGGVIHDNGDGTVSIGPGGGLVKTETGGTSCCGAIPLSINSGQASSLAYVSWDSIPSFDLAGDGYNLIYWDASAGGFSVALKQNFYSAFDFVTDFTIGRVYAQNDTVVARLCGMNVWNVDRRLQMFGEERFPVERATGLIIGATGRQYSVTPGVVWAELLNRFEVTGKAAADSFYLWHKDGGLWVREKVVQVNNTQYNDTTTGLVAFGLSPNTWRADYVYVVHDGTHHVVMGQAQATSEANANLVARPVPPPLLDAYASLIGRITIQKNASTMTASSAFTTTFTASAIPSHNGLSGLQGGTTEQYYHLTSPQHARYDSLVTTKSLSDTAAVLRALLGAGVDTTGWFTWLTPKSDTVSNVRKTNPRIPGLRSNDTSVVVGVDGAGTLVLRYDDAGVSSASLVDSLQRLRDSLRSHTVRINQLVDSVAALRTDLDAIQTGGVTPDCGGVELDGTGQYTIASITTEPEHVSMSRRGADDMPESLRWDWVNGVGLTLYGPPDAMISFCIYYP